MPTKATLSQRKQRLAKMREQRAVRARRREDMLESVVMGVERSVIAKEHGVSLKTVYREINRAIDQRRLDAPDRYVRLQVERLTHAIQCIDRALDDGDLDAVAHLLKVIDKLDRYHGLGVREAAEASPRLVAPTPPLALTHERTDSDA